jgi:ADP-ribose pyrophosphatase YjhB (NUDIX family)
MGLPEPAEPHQDGVGWAFPGGRLN